MCKIMGHGVLGSPPSFRKTQTRHKIMSVICRNPTRSRNPNPAHSSLLMRGTHEQSNELWESLALSFHDSKGPYAELAGIKPDEDTLYSTRYNRRHAEKAHAVPERP